MIPFELFIWDYWYCGGFGAALFGCLQMRAISCWSAGPGVGLGLGFEKTLRRCGCRVRRVREELSFVVGGRLIG